MVKRVRVDGLSQTATLSSSDPGVASATITLPKPASLSYTIEADYTDPNNTYSASMGTRTLTPFRSPVEIGACGQASGPVCGYGKRLWGLAFLSPIERRTLQGLGLSVSMATREFEFSTQGIVATPGGETRRQPAFVTAQD